MKHWKLIYGVIVINLSILIISSVMYLFEYTKLKIEIHMVSNEYLEVTNKYIMEVNKNKTLQQELNEKNTLLQQLWQHCEDTTIVIEEDKYGSSHQKDSKKSVPFMRRTRDRPVQMSEGR